jgi:hypothetical protein
MLKKVLTFHFAPRLKESAQTCEFYDNVFETDRNGWSCVRCASPLTSLPLHPRAIMNQVI